MKRLPLFLPHLPGRPGVATCPVDTACGAPPTEHLFTERASSQWHTNTISVQLPFSYNSQHRILLRYQKKQTPPTHTHPLEKESTRSPQVPAGAPELGTINTMKHAQRWPLTCGQGGRGGSRDCAVRSAAPPTDELHFKNRNSCLTCLEKAKHPLTLKICYCLWAYSGSCSARSCC